VKEFVFNDLSCKAICEDIIRAASRTASGGDSYMVIMELLRGMRSDVILRPKPAEADPIQINIDHAGTGTEISVLTECFVPKYPY
jgi:hypothetical protein